VTIPQEVRERLGIKAATELRFGVEGERAWLEVVRDPVEVRESFARYRGSADIALGTDAILALTRGDDA